MAILIEKAASEDYDKFVEVYAETEELHRINLPWKFKKPEIELFSKSRYQELLENKDAIFLLAKDNEKIVGFVIATKQESQDMPILEKRTYFLLDDLGVRESHRKQGIGATLMAEFEKIAKEKGISDIELNVWSFNKNAISFYESKGYDAINQKMRKVLE